MEHTALFQLNLMLWLVWPQVPDRVLNPVLRTEGFTLKAISPKVSLPFDVRMKAISSSVPVPCKESVRPELLLEHGERFLALLVECKKSSFGPDLPDGGNNTHQCVQAATLLCATGPMIADQYGWRTPGRWKSHLLYTVTAGHENSILETLRELTNRLTSAAIQVTEASSLAIERRDDGIYLKPAVGCTIPINSLQNVSEGIRIVELDPNDDLTPLYLLPWDPSVAKPSEYEERQLKERIRSGLVSLVGSRMDLSRFILTQDQIIEEAFEVWSFWEDEARGKLRKITLQYARSIFTHLRKLGLDIIEDPPQKSFTFIRLSSAASKEVRKYLQSKAFREGDVDLEPKPLQASFGELNMEWR